MRGGQEEDVFNDTLQFFSILAWKAAIAFTEYHSRWAKANDFPNNGLKRWQSWKFLLPSPSTIAVIYFFLIS